MLHRYVWFAVLLFLVGGNLIRAEEGKPCCGEEKAKAQKKIQKAEDLRDPPPCGCPLWQIYPIGGGEYLYHAEYYYENCYEEPEVTGMTGTLDLSPFCHANCIGEAARASARTSKPFPGLEKAVSHDHAFDLPDGDANDFSRPMCDPNLEYIKFKLDPTKPDGYAKVYAFRLSLGRRHQMNIVREQVIYVALELDGTPPDGAATRLAKLKKAEPAADTKLYQATVEQTTPPIQMLVLFAKPK